MKSLFKATALILFGDYGLYQVWTLDALGAPPGIDRSDMGLTVREIGRIDVEAATEMILRESAWYFGDEARGFGCFKGRELVGLAIYWYGQRYSQRHSWPIEDGAAKLVHIVTATAMRGRGVATQLIEQSAVAMHASGFFPLYARIWHSNLPSQRAFARAGWRSSGWLIQINPLRRQLPWSFFYKAASGSTPGSLRTVRRETADRRQLPESSK